MKSSISCSLLAAAMVAGLATMGASPADAATVTCGQVVTSSIKLDADLVDCPGDGLIVGASDITIDLNGHTIDGVSPADYGGGFGIIVRAPHHGVKVVNGTVQEFSFGVWLDRSDDNHLRRLDVTGNNIGVELTEGEGNHIRRSVFDHNRDTGIRLFGADRTRVHHNEFHGGRWGVLLQVGADANRIHRNVIVGDETSTDRGIQIGLDSNRNLVSQNRVSGFDEYGINVDDGERMVIRKNRAIDNPGVGIRIGPDATATTLSRNVANGNGSWGILVLSPVRDPGGNFAAGNGEPDECFGVTCK